MLAACAVCHDNLSSGDQVCAVKCGHVFHNKCWQIWLERKPECPECKSTTKDDLVMSPNHEDSGAIVNHLVNVVDTLSSDIQTLNIARSRLSVTGEQPQSIDLADKEDEVSQDSEPEGAAQASSEVLESSSMGSKDRSIMSGTSSDSDMEDGVPAVGGSSVSVETGIDSVSSYITETDSSRTNVTGSEDTSSDETGSDASSDESDSEESMSYGSRSERSPSEIESEGASGYGNPNDAYLSDIREETRGDTSSSYETEGAVESNGSTTDSDWTSNSDL